MKIIVKEKNIISADSRIYFYELQVECLENTWNILRRLYTDNAFMFEAKLRPCFKSMNEGTNPLPPNTTSPYILPSVLCFHLFGMYKIYRIF